MGWCLCEHQISAMEKVQLVQHRYSLVLIVRSIIWVWCLLKLVKPHSFVADLTHDSFCWAVFYNSAWQKNTLLCMIKNKLPWHKSQLSRVSGFHYVWQFSWEFLLPRPVYQRCTTNAEIRGWCWKWIKSFTYMQLKLCQMIPQ